MIKLKLTEMGDYYAIYPNGEKLLISVAEANKLFNSGKAEFIDE